MNMPHAITQNIPLAPYTTLGAGGKAEFFVTVKTQAELRDVVMWAKKEHHPITILGGGSNILVEDGGVKGLVIRVQCTEILYTEIDSDTVHVTIGAGVSLDTCVLELVQRKLWGLENLSGIPGTMGAVPIQNVGAYGVEAKDVVVCVSVYNTETDTVDELTNEACRFGYRDSLFKHEDEKKYIILSVTCVVTHTPQRKLAYKDLEIYFRENSTPSIDEVRVAVLAIRSKKFPDWNIVGTAGSFFKNPIIPKSEYESLQVKYPDIPGYAVSGGMVKIPLGWVLDSVLHLKGHREDGVGLFEEQALVLVCEKGTSSENIKNFSQKIIDRVMEETGLIVEREVTILK